MNLYLLERINCDEKDGMVIRASSNKNARACAAEQKEMIWCDCRKTSCKKISSIGREEIIIDFTI